MGEKGETMFPQPLTSESFATFGDLLKYLRRRQRLTQLELSIAVGYSEAQISRLEKNQRLPDLATLKALFIPALHLEHEPDLRERLLTLAQSARQEDAPAPGLAPYKGLLFFLMVHRRHYTATIVRSRPSRFAWYSAVSAACSSMSPLSPCLGKVATPIDSVKGQALGH
jgi:transcriptional regulator with XRE-family HTH domain